MKNILLIFLLLSVPLLVFPQERILSSLYSWKKPAQKTGKDILSTILFEGSAHDLEYLQMNANILLPSKKKTSMQVADTEEQLLIIKTGIVSITVHDSTWTIGSGSIALLMPGEKYSLQNTAKDSCHYYTMKYRSRLPVDVARGRASGGSLIKDWNKIEFKPGGKGGSRKFFERPTAMCKRFEMHVTTLNEGLRSHDPHTHRAEEIIVIKENKTEMQIADKFYKGNVGDVYYLGSSVLHAIRNDGVGPCVYFAFQFE
jgi:(S)-ureidoglycine aminohydrolase